MKKLTTGIVAVALASTLAASSAWAGACQVQSTKWNTQQTCGLASRGYGEGSTLDGLKVLKAKSTGVPGGLSSVGAIAVNSSGALINNCAVNDSTEDSYPVGVLGGDCQKGVKFWVQVNY